ncbi:hypothetical protein DSO57_1006758 [Entomophthora muscae]|uniref:Uncharacterized protein n=1 Tax=Entomophthora muscae TaxID=34485 RepID=A0ACC2RMA1_9FUNG|nr:hypothetical protein DSO57_1006758 [Entomophthora muscae]
MPCFVAKPAELLPNTKKPKYHIIPDATHKTVMQLMEKRPDYKKAAAIVGILEKSAHRLQKTYLKTATVVSLTPWYLTLC